MQRAYKIRMYPSNVQKSYLDRCFGISRFAYNKGLEIWNAQHESGEKPSFYSVKKSFNAGKAERYPFVFNVPKSVCDSAIKDLSNGFRTFFGKTGRHPRFHSKKNSKRSFRIDGGRVKVDGKLLTLPKSRVDGHNVGIRPLKLAEPLRWPDAKILNVTVSRSASGKYWATIVCEIPDVPRDTQARNAVGIDMGLKSLATLSDGTKVEKNRIVEGRWKRKKHLQRELARRHRGSKRYEKTRSKLARYEERTKSVKNDWAHKATARIANEYDIVFAEDLNVKGMSKSHSLARSVSDASMSEMLRQLSYKCREFRQVDRWFPSTQTCSSCGSKTGPRGKSGLSVRKWTCPECGAGHDRDVNAASSILYVGMANYPELMPVEGVEVPGWASDLAAERSAKRESTGGPCTGSRKNRKAD